MSSHNVCAHAEAPLTIPVMMSHLACDVIALFISCNCYSLVSRHNIVVCVESFIKRIGFRSVNEKLTTTV